MEGRRNQVLEINKVALGRIKPYSKTANVWAARGRSNSSLPELVRRHHPGCLYPTSLLFRVVRSIQRGLADLRQGKRIQGSADGVDLTEWEEIVEIPRWAAIEKRFGARL